jgi:DegV family protein with EDD domain
LKVKPILGVVEGKLAALDRVRTKAKVIDKLLEIMGERLAGNSPLHVSVLHGNSPQEAEQLEQEVITRYNPAEVLRSEITPVIGTYTGPGTLGLAFYNE